MRGGFFRFPCDTSTDLMRQRRRLRAIDRTHTIPRPVRTPLLASFVLSSLICFATSASEALPKLFDPNRHMRVDEVKPGMKGYGLTVFLGTKIEKFDVEVVSVMRNFNPKRDAILIRCFGETMEHTGSVAGMSGSPIFLKDDQGRPRMIGAFAYGWPMAKDPIAGVQPIEYMLQLADNPPNPSTRNAPRAGVRNGTPWNVLNALRSTTLFPPAARQITANTASLRRMLTPVSVSGVPANVLARYADVFTANNLGMYQSGGGVAPGEPLDVPIEPGSVVITPLVTGDVEFHANGTCTEVLDGHVFAFGHPFFNEGAVDIPLAGGAVQGIVASLDSSFKMAAMGKLKGAIDTDHTVGIAGRLGPSPASIPVDIKINRDGKVTAYHFDAIRHPRLLPVLVAISMESALSSEGELPQYNTLHYAIDMQFENGRKVQVNNVDANVAPGDLIIQLIAPLSAAAENPFERVLPKRVEGTLTLTGESRDSQILSVQLPKTKFRPGDSISGFITHRPFRAEEANLPFKFDLPRDLPDGPYQLVVGDWTRYFGDELTAKPFRFAAETSDEVFDVMQDVYAVRHDALYVRLLRQPDGVAVGRVAMNQLPSSRRQVLLGAGRSNVTQFVSSNVVKLKTDQIMTGSAEFTITIEKKTKVESGRVSAPATRPAG